MLSAEAKLLDNAMTLLPQQLASALQSRLRWVWNELAWHCFVESHWTKRSGTHRWVFVTGCNRSGKTTLANLLANHPEVSVIPNANWHTKALPNSATEGCPHIWTEKLNRFRLTDNDGMEAAPRLVFDWLAYRNSQQPVIVVESDLAAVQMQWLQKVFRNSYFIGLIRNGYAVAEGIRLKEGYSIERCARQWNVANRVMFWDAKFIHNFKLVRFEEFVANPVKVAEGIATSIGIDPAPLWPFLLHGWRLGNTDSTSSKLRNANHELIKRLSSDDIEKITANAYQMMESLGYLPRQDTAVTYTSA